MVQKIPPPTGEELELLEERFKVWKRRLLTTAALTTFVVGFILACKLYLPTSPAFGWHVLDAFLCLLNVVNLVTVWRSYRWAHSLVHGQAVMSFTGKEELTVLYSPRKVGRPWIAVRFMDVSFWNLPARLFPTKGRGETPAHAIFDMWSQAYNLGTVPQDRLNKMFAAIDDDFLQELERNRGPLEETRVE